MKKNQKIKPGSQKGLVPRYVPGDEDILDEPATPEERKSGEFTRVTHLSWDEDPPR